MNPPLRLDAHQHFWDPARKDYGWLTADMPSLFKPIQPADLEPFLVQHQIDGTVLVQAAPTIAETDYLLDLARKTPFVKAVVGWIDFENPDHRVHLQRWAKNPLLKSLRPMVQDIADPDWLLKPEIDWAFETLQDMDLAFDALILPVHLERLLKRLKRHPRLRVCIDHGAKPEIRHQIFEPWAEQMAQLAHETSAFCKISGLVTEAKTPWIEADLGPYLDHLHALFGPKRLIFGSDWPVLNLNGTYSGWMTLLERWTQHWSHQDRSDFFGGNAMRFYGLSLPTQP